eukprot:gene6716-3386_t
MLVLCINTCGYTLDRALKGSGAAQQEEEEEEEDSSAGSAEHTKKTSLGFTPFHLAFRDIKYHVPKPGHLSKELTLLKGISGVFAPGRLTALMGASGAGKTTHWDLLGTQDRKEGGREEGTVTLNGYPKVQKTFARVMGYVEQFDIHCSQATVHEALMFSGKMRLPEDTDDAVKSKLGQSFKGLDARAASIVMRAVRNTVNTGRTVVCTIHQPSLEIFQAFDELLLLKRGGETIFFGDMGVDQVGNNPANWMLDVSAADAEIELGADFADFYKKSPLKEKVEKRLDTASQPVEGTGDLHFDTAFSVSSLTQLREKASGMYSPAPFATAQGIVEIPYIMVQAVVYVLIVYWMAGFEATATKFFWFLLYNWLNLTCITYFGIMAINLTPAVEFGTVFVAFFFTLWNLTCGFVSPQPLGDVNDEFINVGGIGEPEELMHSFIGWVVLIQFAFIATFRSVSIIALLRLNFQKR